MMSVSWLLAVAYGQLVMEFPGGRTAGFVAGFGSDVTEKVTWSLESPEDPYGCNATENTKPGAVLLVKRGECSFSQKAEVAHEMSAGGLIVIDDIKSHTPLQMSGNGTNYTFPIIGVMYRRSIFQGTSPDRCTAWVYVPLAFDVSEVLLVLLATALVAAGAYFSITDLHKSRFVSAPPEIIVLDGLFPLAFVLMGSGALVFLFFFMHYAIYLLLTVFCIGGVSGLQQLIEPVVAHYFPATKAKVLLDLRRSDIVATIPSVVVVALFIVYRNYDKLGWLFQDIIAVGLLCQIQKSLRLPSIKIASITLVLMFFFDIFWVFISPLIFQKSVMIEVAKGGGTGESIPMVLKIPAILDDLPNQRMLGFGDVALPGLLISYLLRHDTVTKRTRYNGYFWPSVLAYAVGLVATLIALRIMSMGQPALLYLVPSTLGTTLVLGYRRNELGCLWRGVSTAESDAQALVPMEQRSPLSFTSDDTKQE